MLAIFKTGEVRHFPRLTCIQHFVDGTCIHSKSSVLQESRSYTSLAGFCKYQEYSLRVYVIYSEFFVAQGQGPRTISSSRGSLCSEVIRLPPCNVIVSLILCSSQNSPVFDERNPPATFESNPDFSPPNVPGIVGCAESARYMYLQ